MSLDTARASLTRRRYAGDARESIASDRWAFARTEGGVGLDAQGAETALVESDTHIHVFDGFEPGWIYELVYTARDPRPYGIGHAVVRDLVSFLRYDKTDGCGVANPLAGAIDKAYAWGRSQTGRCIRDFVYRGYNADARGRRVFDGVMPHVAGAGLMWMNHRFARVVNPAGQQYEDHENCADRFPFAYGSSVDHLTGREDAILKRPGTESAGPAHAKRDGVLAAARVARAHRYRGSRSRASGQRPRLPVGEFAALRRSEHPPTGARHLPALRERRFRRRCCFGRCSTPSTPGPPMASSRRRVGSRAARTGRWWTTMSGKVRFSDIPGVMVPSSANALPLYDFGPDFERGLLTIEPPEVVDARGYAVLVPAVDADGNDVAGVRAPMVEAPLGTCVGWNLRAREFGHGAMHQFTGSYLPFPDTDSEAAMTGDPRASVLARYRSAGGYADAIGAAARRLVDERLMLEEDVERVVARAQDWGRPLHDVRL